MVKSGHRRSRDDDDTKESKTDEGSSSSDEEKSASVEEARTSRLKHTKSVGKAKPKELTKLVSMPGNV